MRRRQTEVETVGTDEGTSPKDQLSRDLHETWKVAEREGYIRRSYIELLQRTSSGKGKSRTFHCTKCFDCIWTIVLFLLFVVLLMIYVKPIGNTLQTHLHDKIYPIHRFMRFAFLMVHPYLQALGIDLTHICLKGNPLVNSTMYCPCIENHSSIVLSAGTSLVKAMSPFPSIIHNAFSVTEVYGRQTLLKYRAVYYQMPSMCMQISLGEKGPNTLDQIVNPEKWKKWERLTEPWGFMW